MTIFSRLCNIRNVGIAIFYLAISQLTYGQNSDVNYKGYTNITEIIYSIGTEDVKIDNTIIEKSNSIGITTVNGYQFNKYFSVGLGIGFEKIENKSFIPLFLDARMSFLQGKIHPTLNGIIGYLSPIYNLGEHFLFINPSAGIRVELSDKISYLLNIGFKWYRQETTYSGYGYGYGYGNETINQESGTKYTFIPHLSISTGIKF
jgi:hypothetical protein